MYRQRDDVANQFNLPTQAKNSKTFLYYKANCSDERRNDPTPGWMVGSGDCKFGLKSSTDTANPPVTGWQFWSDSFGGRKRDDESLKLEFGSLAPCSRVDVAARGEAGEILKSRLGSYYPEGRWSQGRPIYRFTGDRKINYLRVAPGAAFWSLSESATSLGGYLQGGKGTLSPGDPAAGPNLKSGLEGWNYWTGKEWEDSGSRVTVSCPTGESHSRVSQITRRPQRPVAKCPHFSDSRGCSTASCAALVLSSTERAAEFHGRYLGEWMLVEGACSDGRPVYSRREDLDNRTQFSTLLYYKASCSDPIDTLQDDTAPGWIVGTGGCGYILANPADTAFPPLSGWRLADSSSDPSLRLEFGSLDPCSRVDVAGRGGAAVIRKKEMGTYLPTGQWSQGRPVYSKTEGETRYLVLIGYKWCIVDNLEATPIKPYLEAGRGTSSPGHPATGPSLSGEREGWYYWDGTGWEDAGSRITVTCPAGQLQHPL